MLNTVLGTVTLLLLIDPSFYINILDHFVNSIGFHHLMQVAHS